MEEKTRFILDEPLGDRHKDFEMKHLMGVKAAASKFTSISTPRGFFVDKIMRERMDKKFFVLRKVETEMEDIVIGDVITVEEEGGDLQDSYFVAVTKPRLVKESDRIVVEGKADPTNLIMDCNSLVLTTDAPMEIKIPKIKDENK